MTIFQLSASYFLWHYTVAWGDVLRLYRNFSWFFWNFFSIGLLSETLLSPWHRLHEGSNDTTGGLLGSIILNLILRCIGFLARVCTILTGLVALFLLSFFFLVFLALWPFLPFLIVIFIIQGLIGLVVF